MKRQREFEKEGRQRRRAKRESFKTKAQWDKEAQSAFNRYIRIRDEGKPCVSCGNPLIGKSNYLTGSAIDASHYRSRGAASHLKFNVFNVHSACTRCNRQLSGNAVEYRIHLIERIGRIALSALRLITSCAGSIFHTCSVSNPYSPAEPAHWRSAAPAIRRPHEP